MNLTKNQILDQIYQMFHDFAAYGETLDVYDKFNKRYAVLYKEHKDDTMDTIKIIYKRRNIGHLIKNLYKTDLIVLCNDLYNFYVLNNS